MARTFREYMEELSPPWLLTSTAKPFMQAIGQVKDGLLWTAKEALYNRLPGYASNDALALLGAERGIARAADETRESYAGRVRKAWDSWAYGGTPLGMLSALVGAGYTNVALATFNRRLYTMDGAGAVVTQVLPVHSWLFRATTDTYWSRFIVLFPDPLIPRWIADGVPGSGSSEANVIRELIRRWKPAHMVCDDIRIATSDETWDYFPEAGTWNDPGSTWATETTWTSWTP